MEKKYSFTFGLLFPSVTDNLYWTPSWAPMLQYPCNPNNYQSPHNTHVMIPWYWISFYCRCETVTGRNSGLGRTAYIYYSKSANSVCLITTENSHVLIMTANKSKDRLLSLLLPFENLKTRVSSGCTLEYPCLFELGCHLRSFDIFYTGCPKKCSIAFWNTEIQLFKSEWGLECVQPNNF